MLVGLYGLGLIGAGIFVADPTGGFPPGTPQNASTVSRHGLLHFVTGGIGFLGPISACFVFASRFAALGERGWVAFSVVTGVFYFAAFFGIASGSQHGGAVLTFVVLTFTAAVVLGVGLCCVGQADDRASRCERLKIASGKEPCWQHKGSSLQGGFDEVSFRSHARW